MKKFIKYLLGTDIIKVEWVLLLPIILLARVLAEIIILPIKIYDSYI